MPKLLRQLKDIIVSFKQVKIAESIWINDMTFWILLKNGLPKPERYLPILIIIMKKKVEELQRWIDEAEDYMRQVIK